MNRFDDHFSDGDLGQVIDLHLLAGFGPVNRIEKDIMAKLSKKIEFFHPRAVIHSQDFVGFGMFRYEPKDKIAGGFTKLGAQADIIAHIVHPGCYFIQRETKGVRLESGF